jgi:YidC/Oxa1 family membrane protein insertase
MDNQRLLVWAAFGLMLWFTYQAWIQDYGPKPAPVVQGEAVQQADIPDDAEGELPDLAEAPTEAPSLEAAAEPESEAVTADIIRVRTDVLDLEISTQGGTIRRAILRKYPVAKDRPDQLVELLSPERANLGLLQTGLRAKDRAEPNHLANFQAAQTEYSLGDTDELVIPLTWSDGLGVSVRKTFRLTRGSYRIDLSQAVVNESDAAWEGADYAQIRRRSHEPERSMFDVDTYSFDGPVFFDGEKSEKLDRDDLLSDGPLTQTATDGWIASIQHHFLSAIEPAAGQRYTYRASVQNDVAVSSLIGGTQVVAPGITHTFETTLFVGPKLQDQLEEISPKLKLTVDYGWLTILSQPLFWLLSKVHDFVRNWGVSIILVTILIKLAFYKLTETSGRSMAKMREIQPRMKGWAARKHLCTTSDTDFSPAASTHQTAGAGSITGLSSTIVLSVLVLSNCTRTSEQFVGIG